MTDPNESTDLPDLRRLLEGVVALARAAAVPIARVYATDFDVRHKDDRSPVTEADTAAEEVIVAGLRELSPAIPIVSEEATGSARPEAPGSRFWLVDPLDGTLEFVRRNGEFTINIALIDHGLPLLGVVFAPVLDRLCAGAISNAATAFEERAGARRPIAARPPGPDGWTIVASRSHGDALALEGFVGGRSILATSKLGSSLKFCVVASGDADFYPRFGRTMEWDTAAGHAVLRAAGGCVTELSGTELRYGKPGLVNPGFVAWGTPSAGWLGG